MTAFRQSWSRSTTAAADTTPPTLLGQVQEADLERRVLEMFERIRIKDQVVREWFSQVLRAKNKTSLQTNNDRITELTWQIDQEEQLLELRLLEEIDD